MEPYSEKELIEFTNQCIENRYDPKGYTGFVNDAELQNWKETLKQERREQKINEILNGTKNKVNYDITWCICNLSNYNYVIK